MDPKAEIIDLEVQFISLVRKGANRKRLILKSAEFDESKQTFSRFIRIQKVDRAKQMIYGIVYAPGEVDTDGDTATEEVIERACEKFMKEGLTGNVDSFHKWVKEEGAFVKESWIVKEIDPFFTEKGAWAVGIKVEDSGLWDQVEKGEIAGLSIGGFAERVELDKARGDGQGQGGARQGDGGADACVCPACGATMPHNKGEACSKIMCPECGTPMTGENKSMDIEKDQQEALGFWAKVHKAIKGEVAKESSSFEEVVDYQEFWRYFDALAMSCQEVLRDEELDHAGKMGKISQSLDQFKSSFATLKTEKLEAGEVEKAGKVLSKKNLDALMSALGNIQKIIEGATTQKEDGVMDSEVKKALEGITERLEKLEKPPAGDTPPEGGEKAIEKQLAEIVSRIEKLENPEQPAGEDTPPEVSEEVQKLQKAVEDISGRLEKLENPDGDGAPEKSETVKAIEKSLEEMTGRIAKLEKARGISHKAEGEGNDQPPVEKSHVGPVRPKTKHFG